MSYVIDPSNGDIVIKGFENGLADSPYSGLTDIKGVNVDSVKGEAAVAFQTQTAFSAVQLSGVTMTSYSGGSNIFTFTGIGTSGLEVGQAIYFTASSVTGGSGLTNNIPYWIAAVNLSFGVPVSFEIATSYVSISPYNAGVVNGTTTFNTYNPALPKFFAQAAGANFMIDGNGCIWSNANLTVTTSSWTYTGNLGTQIDGQKGGGAYGNGFVYWRTANSTTVGDWDGYLFIFRDGFIDYCNVDGVNNGVAYTNYGSYVYGWSPLAGSTGVGTAYLTGSNLTGCPHNAIVGPDGNLYFVDYYTTWKIQQFNITTPTTFDPTNTATYIVTQAYNLPIQTIATCIAPFGDNFLIGGNGNVAYQWNGVDQLNYTTAILLAEAYVWNIVTVNTNAYLFAGNRGNIYITNGSQANVWKKVPDYISGVAEPYLYWGGACFQKGRLYFGVYASTNSGVTISGYGGVWSVNVETGVMSQPLQLSNGSYAGYATAISAVQPTYPGNGSIIGSPPGYGLLIGWSLGASSSSAGGIDTTISNPYSGGQSWITSELIPVGTTIDPTTGKQVEFKLLYPLVAGESVQIKIGSYLDPTYASFVSAGTFTTVSGNMVNSLCGISNGFPVQQQQWCIVQTILNSTNTNPSYCPLSEIRLKGFSKKLTSYQTLT